MDLKESIDYAVEAIVKQGGRCMAPGSKNACAYGGIEPGDDRHCFIGHLLDPDNSDLMNSGQGVHSLSQNFESVIPAIISDNIRLFCILQRFHDSNGRQGRLNAWHSALELQAQDQSLEDINFNNPAFMQWVEMGEVS